MFSWFIYSCFFYSSNTHLHFFIYSSIHLNTHLSFFHLFIYSSNTHLSFFHLFIYSSKALQELKGLHAIPDKITFIFPKNVIFQIQRSQRLLMRFQKFQKILKLQRKCQISFFLFSILIDGTLQTSSVKFLSFWFAYMNFSSKTSFYH